MSLLIVVNAAPRGDGALSSAFRLAGALTPREEPIHDLAAATARSDKAVSF